MLLILIRSLMLRGIMFLLRWRLAKCAMDWFEQLRKEMGGAVIAVAHHRDDSVETFFY